MKRKIEITYNWRRDDDSDNNISKKHLEALEESAQERIFEQIKEGNTGGELNDRVRMFDEDGEDGIGYTGWWEMRITSEI